MSVTVEYTDPYGDDPSTYAFPSVAEAMTRVLRHADNVGTVVITHSADSEGMHGWLVARGDHDAVCEQFSIYY